MCEQFFSRSGTSSSSGLTRRNGNPVVSTGGVAPVHSLSGRSAQRSNPHGRIARHLGTDNLFAEQSSERHHRALRLRTADTVSPRARQTEQFEFFPELVSESGLRRTREFNYQLQQTTRAIRKTLEAIHEEMLPFGYSIYQWYNRNLISSSVFSNWELQPVL